MIFICFMILVKLQRIPSHLGLRHVEVMYIGANASIGLKLINVYYKMKSSLAQAPRYCQHQLWHLSAKKVNIFDIIFA